MATIPTISMHDAVGDNPLNDYRGSVTWGTITMETPRFELIYAAWNASPGSRPSAHPLVALTNWSQIQTWAAGFKTFLSVTAGYDSSYTGWLCFDHWEDYPLTWEWAVYLGSSVLTVFREAARATYPELTYMTPSFAEASIGRLYNRCVQRIHSEVARQVKSLCPNASYAFYENTATVNTDAAEVTIAQDVHDRVLHWMYQLVDAKTVRIYSFHKSVASSPGSGEALTADVQTYMTAAVSEAVRVAAARSLQCLIFCWDEYHGSNATYGGQRVADADIDLQLQTAVDEGADGVLMWHAFTSAAEVTSFNTWTAGNLEPVVAALTPAA